jgi:hypothetical protein
VGFFKHAMVFGKYLQTYNTNNQQKFTGNTYKQNYGNGMSLMASTIKHQLVLTIST